MDGTLYPWSKILNLDNVQHTSYVIRHAGRGCPTVYLNRDKEPLVLLAVHCELAIIVDRRLLIKLPFFLCYLILKPAVLTDKFPNCQSQLHTDSRWNLITRPYDSQ